MDFQSNSRGHVTDLIAWLNLSLLSSLLWTLLIIHLQ